MFWNYYVKGFWYQLSEIIHKACFELMSKAVDINASEIIHKARVVLLSKGANINASGIIHIIAYRYVVRMSKGVNINSSLINSEYVIIFMSSIQSYHLNENDKANKDDMVAVIMQ